MKTFVKKNGFLEFIGEGTTYSKKNIVLREDETNGKCSVTLNPDGQDVEASKVQTTSQNIMNKVTQADSVTLQSDDVKGITAPTYSANDPRNDTVQEIPIDKANGAAIQNAAKNGGTIKIKKRGSAQLSLESRKRKSDIVEMRRNSIPFTKKELGEFLRTI